jgi:hypothetical protein
MKYETIKILSIFLLFIILIPIPLFSIFGNNTQFSSFKTQTSDFRPQTSVGSDTTLIDALPQKPKVNALALENAMKKNPNTTPGMSYDFIFLTLITLVLYFVTYFLSVKNIIRKAIHRRIWNILLLLLAIVAVFGGFIATAQLKYNIMMTWYKDILFWHVEAGISMTVIAIFHIWWHRKYFINIFYK